MYKTFSEFIFPKQIVVCDDFLYENYKSKLIENCYDEKKIDPTGASYSNIGGWQSTGKIFDLNDQKFNFFTKRLKSIVNSCVNEEMYFLENVEIVFNHWWINISGPNCYNVFHRHPGFHYSGIFYVKSQKNCGQLAFRQNTHYTQDHPVRMGEFMDKNNYHHSRLYDPIEGRTILFPSNLGHDVLLNNSNEDRISISFDMKFILKSS